MTEQPMGGGAAFWAARGVRIEPEIGDGDEVGVEDVAEAAEVAETEVEVETEQVEDAPAPGFPQQRVSEPDDSPADESAEDPAEDPAEPHAASAPAEAMAAAAATIAPPRPRPHAVTGPVPSTGSPSRPGGRRTTTLSPACQVPGRR